MDVISRLGIGPLSPDIIEAAYSYSQEKAVPLMLIASKNQIDVDRGYVFHTREYRSFLDELRKKYSQANVYICRDHCGPGHNSVFDLQDTYRTIDTDLEYGFDLIHIDFCFHRGSYDDVLKESKRAITYIQKRSPQTFLEIGTDENSGMHVENIMRVEEQMKYFTSFCQPHFFVTQTGTLIKEIQQVGTFYEDYVKKLRLLANTLGLALKEHNADYLPAAQITRRKGVVDAVNVAPQFGVIQTQLTLARALTYGLDIQEFLDISYRSRKWEKWLLSNNEHNKLLCSVIAGHYNFSTDAYQHLYEKLHQHENFSQAVQQEMHRIFDAYIENLDQSAATATSQTISSPLKRYGEIHSF